MRSAQLEAPSGESEMSELTLPMSEMCQPFGLYSPRGTMTSQQSCG